jgi:hypothetical protein
MHKLRGSLAAACQHGGTSDVRRVCFKGSYTLQVMSAVHTNLLMSICASLCQWGKAIALYVCCVP